MLREQAGRWAALAAAATLLIVLTLLIWGNQAALAGDPPPAIQSRPAAAAPRVAMPTGPAFEADARAIQAGPVPNPGFTADLTYQTIYGWVSAGDVVTVSRTAGGAAYGAAETDGTGFFWTNLYDGAMNGHPVAIAGGDTLEVYVNGSLAATLNPLAISGEVDVLDDEVNGTVTGLGAGTSVTVTMGELGNMPAAEPQVVTTVDASGNFTASFTALADLGPQMMAQVEYRDGGGHTILAYLYPSEVFRVLNFSSVQGYAAPETVVTVTVYVTYPTDVRWSNTGWANWPHGLYNVSNVWVSDGDVVEVELSGGPTLQLNTSYLEARPNATTDQVTGLAPNFSPVRGYLWNAWDGTYVEDSTVANGSGAYTLTLAVDLQSRHFVYAGYADAEGDELGLSGPPSQIRAYPDFSGLYAFASRPHVPVTYTLNTAAGTFVEYRWCAWNNGCEWVGGYELQAGDVITAEFPGESISMVIADVSLGPDTDGNAAAGEVDRAGFLQAEACQWTSSHYPTHGCATTSGSLSAGAYNQPFAGFDVRDGMEVFWAYFYDAASGHMTFARAGSPDGTTSYFQVDPSYNAVGGVTHVPDQFITAWLYDTDGTTLLASTSQDQDDSPWSFWFGDFQGQEILPGRWVTITGDSGWSAGLQVPTLTLQVDEGSDMAWGQAPKALLEIAQPTPEGWWNQRVPVDDYYFDFAYFGRDLVAGEQVYATYQALNGNRVQRGARLGELFRVEFWLAQNGPTDMWGEAQPGTMVTVTTPLTQVYVYADPGCGGCWNAYVGDLYPGDAVNVVAGAGADPLNVTIPDPLSAEADSATDQVWGQVGGWLSQTVEIHGNWPDGYREATTDLSGNYSVTYPDVPRGGDGYLRYVDQSGYTQVIYHRPFQAPDLLMRANYGHDWVEGNYEPGHTLWVTVTDEFGGIKATAELQTGPIPWWGGQSGFSTSLDDPWQPGQPDMMAGDWVYGRMDNGQMAEIQLGEITGVLDVGADTIGGNVYAGWWAPSTLDAWCSVWEDGGPYQDFQVDPDGGSYFCEFGPMGWNLLPNHSVAVGYFEPDGDQVMTVFQEPVPNLRLEKWPEGNGQAAAGGTAIYHLRLRNDGEATADPIILTDTLPANTTYVTDSSGIAPSLPPGQVIWTLGPLDPGQQIQFQLVLQNSATPGDVLHNVADAWVAYDNDPDNNHAEADIDVVAATPPDVYVNKYPDPGDPAAGQTMVWSINYGNNNPLPSGPVTLTDTLPADTSVVGWYSTNGFGLWTEVSRNGQLVLEAPTLPGNWGDTLEVRILLDGGLMPGTQLTNTVEITAAAGDTDPGSNWHQRDDVWVNEFRWDSGVYKEMNWGQLTPGGVIEYNLHTRNHGNVTTHIWLTDTLPAGTAYDQAWAWDGMNYVPMPPDYIGGGLVAWDLGNFEPTQWLNIDLRLSIDGATAPGTVLVNCARITIDGDDNWLYNNESCRSDTVREPGPNLQLVKQYRWNWEGQLEYEIQFRNLGTTTLYDVVMTDTLPTNTSFNGNWWHDFWEQLDLTYDDGSTLAWTVARLEPTWSSRIHFQADLDGGLIGEEGLAYTNTVEGPIPGDIYPDDNTSIVTAYTGPDIYIEKWLSGGQPEPGAIVTFTVEFGNSNRWPWHSDDQAGSVLTDSLPAGMTFITATAPWDPGQIWYPSYNDGQTVAWDWGPMWSENIWVFDLAVQLADTVQSGEVLVNTIEAWSTGEDTEYDYTNNQFELPLTVLAPVLEISKTYETEAMPGGVVTYTLTVRNSGNLTATNVVVNDTLPAGLTYGGGDGSFDGTNVAWTIASIPPGGSASVWFWATLPGQGTVTNDTYSVVDSDQGATSAPGAPVSFEIAMRYYYLPMVVKGYTAP